MTETTTSNSRPGAIAPAGSPAGRAEAVTTPAGEWSGAPATRGPGGAGVAPLVEVLLQGQEHHRHRGRSLRHRRAEGVQGLARVVQVGRLAGDAMERQQVEDRHAVAAGQGVVERVLGARQQALVVVAVKKKPPSSWSSKSAIIRSISDWASRSQRASPVAGVQPEQTVRQEGVVLQVGGNLGLPAR